MQSITIKQYKAVFGTGCQEYVRTIELVSGDNETWKENTASRLGNFGKAFKAGVLESLANGQSVQTFNDDASFTKKKDRYTLYFVANA